MNVRRNENSIPLLDLDGFDTVGRERSAFLANLREAARRVGFFYLKGRLRSHPDVAKRYYADLVEPGSCAPGAAAPGASAPGASAPGASAPGASAVPTSAY